jgi:hypothetical protein
MVIKEEEAQGAKAAGVSLGSENGRMTASFLKGVLDKYSDGSVGSQGLSSHVSSTRPATQSRYGSAEASNGHTTKGEISGEEPTQVQIPQRSFTVAVREPVTGLRDFKSTFTFTDLDFTPSAQLLHADGNIQPLRRAQTLPVHFNTDFTAFFPDSTEMLPPKSGSVLQQLDDISNTDDIGALADRFSNPISSSPIRESSSLSDSPQRSFPSPTIRNTAIETREVEEVTIPQELEEPRQVTMTPGITTAPLDISINNKSDNESKVLSIYSRLLLSEFGAGESTNHNTRCNLAFALHVTEAMSAGFIDMFFASQQDERELAKEVQRALQGSPNNSDSDSNGDESTVASASDDSDDSEGE